MQKKVLFRCTPIQIDGQLSDPKRMFNLKNNTFYNKRQEPM